MNREQQLVTDCVRNYLKKIYVLDFDFDEDVLNESIKFARKHKIHTLFYAYLSRTVSERFKVLNILKTLKNDTILNGIIQSKHNNIIYNIIRELNKEGLELILLKGLVLRELYPNPDLRIMGDSDILIKIKDLTQIAATLKKFGYFETKTNSEMHAHFSHEKELPIELHWSLTEERTIKTYDDFTKEAWLQAIEFSYYGIKVLKLSHTYEVAYLVIHMASHFFSTGIGLRQYFDLSLYIESEYKNILWEDVFDILSNHECKKFGCFVFKLCNIIYKINIPINGYENVLSSEVFNRFLLDTFDGGTFGKSNFERCNSNRFVRYVEYKSAGEINYIMSVKEFLFPNIKKMGEEYKYAKANKFLIPFAWISRLFFNIRRKELKKIISSLLIKDKKNTFKLAESRNRLLNELKDDCFMNFDKRVTYKK